MRQPRLLLLLFMSKRSRLEEVQVSQTLASTTGMSQTEPDNFVILFGHHCVATTIATSVSVCSKAECNDWNHFHDNTNKCFARSKLPSLTRAGFSISPNLSRRNLISSVWQSDWAFGLSQAAGVVVEGEGRAIVKVLET